MIKARPKYPMDFLWYYLHRLQHFLLMLDPGWTSGYFLMLDPASKVNIVGMIRQMTTAFFNIIDVNSTIQVRRVFWSGFTHTGSLLK
jgi:hypothetical protein